MDEDLAAGRARAAGRRRGTVAGLAGSIYFTTLLGIVTGPIVARGLGPGGRGEVATTAVYPTLVAVVLSVGVPQAVGHFAAKRDEDVPALLGATIRLALLMALPAFAFGALLVVGPLAELSRAARVGTFVLVALTPLNVVSFTQRSMLMARSELRPMSLVRVLPIALNAVATIGLALIGHLTIGTYVAGTVLGSLVVNAVMWRLLRERPAGGFPLAPLFGFGIRSVGGSLANMGNQQLDQAVLVFLAGPRQLGLYAVAVTVAQLPQGLGQAVAARAFGEVGRRGNQIGREVGAAYIRAALLSGVVMGLGVAALAPIVVPLLYGRPFGPAVIPLLLLLPGSVLLSASTTATQILTAIGRPGAVSSAEGIALAVTVVGLLIAVPVAGIHGAAVVSSLAYITRAGIQIHVLRGEGFTGFMPTTADARRLVGAMVAIARPGRGRRPPGA